MAAKRKRRRTRATLGEMSKKDYVAIGNILCRNGASTELVRDIADYFAADNASFKPATFVSHVSKCKR